MGRIAFWGLIVMVALAPLPLGSNRPGPWSALAVATGALLLLWGVAAFREPGIQQPWQLHWPVTLGFFAIVAWLYLQTVSWTPVAWHHPIWREAAEALATPLPGAISISPANGVNALMRLLTYGGVFWLAMQFGRSRRRARAALWSVVLAATAYALYGIAVELAGNQTILWYQKWTYLDSLTATFVNRNSFASYAGMALIVALALLKRRLREVPIAFDRGPGEAIERHARIGGPLFVGILILGSALLLSHSRGGLISLLAGLVVLVGSELLRNRTSGAGRRFALAVAAVAVLLVAVGGGATLQRLIYPTGLEDVRVAIAKQTIVGIEQTPWSGIGYGTFEAAFNLWGGAGNVEIGRVDKAHNTYLEFAAETGLPAFAVMLGVLGWIVARCGRGIMVRRRDVIFPEVALAVSVQLGLHSFFDFSLQIPAVAVVYSLLLGIGFAQVLPRREVAEGESAADTVTARCG
jgi:O-antigen ligase